MIPARRSAALAAGLVLAAVAAAVSVEAWRAERALHAGRTALRRGALREAQGAFREGAARGSVDAAVESARVSVALREWEEAQAAVGEALALSPAQGRPHLLQGAIELGRPGAWDAGREERVLEACRRGLALEPAPAQSWREAGDVVLGLYALRRPAWDAARAAAVLGEAIGDYGEALKRQPQQAPAVLAGILAAGGGAEVLVEAARRHGDPPVLAAAAAALHGSGAWPVERSRELVAADPGDAGAWYLLGEVLRRAGRRAEAREAHAEAARLAPAVGAYRAAAGLR